MSFQELFNKLDFQSVRRKIESATREEAERTLSSEDFSINNLHTLLAPAADFYLEDMARLSSSYTEERFGKTIQLYAPLYLSNFCTNACAYCGFSALNKEAARRTLKLEEIKREYEALERMGIRHVLLVSGEAPKEVSLEYLKKAVEMGKNYASHLTLEVYPLETEGYFVLVEAGAEGLTIYQETYDTVLYRQFHKGKKADFNWRLEAPDRAAEAGMLTIGVGALLGLNDPKTDVFFAACHADYIRNKYWKTGVSVSFPRMREAKGISFKPVNVSDRELVRFICALRLTLREAGITISTRESAPLRDNLVGLGVTQMSAGSATSPGGYTEASSAETQFQVEDARSVEEFAAMLESKNYAPVYKDNVIL